MSSSSSKDKVIGPASVAVIWSNRIFSLHVLLGLLACPVFISTWLQAPFFLPLRPPVGQLGLYYLGIAYFIYSIYYVSWPLFRLGLYAGVFRFFLRLPWFCFRCEVWPHEPRLTLCFRPIFDDSLFCDWAFRFRCPVFSLGLVLWGFGVCFWGFFLHLM